MSTVRAPNPPSRLNRSLLAALGLLLLAAGAAVLAVGLGLLPGVGPDTALLPSLPTTAGWGAYAAAAAGTLLGLLALRWLLAQAHRRPPESIWQLDGSSTTPGSTALPTSAAATAIARDVSAYRGVDTATATLAGARSAPTVHLDVAVETHPSVADLRDRITDEALPRLRTALQTYRLPAQLVPSRRPRRDPTRALIRQAPRPWSEPHDARGRACPAT